MTTPRTRSQEWIARDGGWRYEYAMFCLGHSLATAGGFELAYRTGHADRDIAELTQHSHTTVVREIVMPEAAKRSVIYG